MREPMTQIKALQSDVTSQDWVSGVRIDRGSPMPLHVQIRSGLLELIDRERPKTGQRLTTEMGLCRMLGVSITPVRKAVDGLVHDGIVERRRAKGIFIAQPHRKPAATKSLGFVVPAVSHNFFGDMVHGAELAARTLGYQLFINNTDYEQSEESAILGKFTSAEMAGVLLVPTTLADTPRNVVDVHRMGVPVVLVDRGLDGVALDLVGSDNAAIGRDAARHLIEMGHRRIVYVTHRANQFDTSRLRQSGYEHLMNAHGFQPRTEAVSWPETDAKPSIPADEVERILSAGEQRPTALFVVNDTMAVDLCRSLKTLGLGVPDDVSVLGVADLDVGRFLERPLTTISQRTFEMGRTAVKLLLDKIEGRVRDEEPRHITIPHELVVRQSCAPPKDQVSKV